MHHDMTLQSSAQQVRDMSYRQLWVEHDGGHIVRMPLQRLHARLGLVVPDLGHTVVSAGYQEWPVTCVDVQEAGQRQL